MDKIICDGAFGMNKGCSKKAEYIARSDIDPLICVYYCCEEHKGTYQEQGFIVGKL